MSEAPLARHHRYTYRDYLALEQDANVKHEFFDGEIYAMAGGTPDHAALAVEVSSTLHGQLRSRGCRVFSSDLRVRVLATGLTTYPDVTVICGDAESDPEDRHTLVNPTLVVEVTSDGTEDYDRTEKLEHYKRIPSLGAVLLVSHREKRIDLWQRTNDGSWQARSVSTGESLAIESLRVSFSVDDVYAGSTIDR